MTLGFVLTDWRLCFPHDEDGGEMLVYGDDVHYISPHVFDAFDHQRITDAVTTKCCAGLKTLEGERGKISSYPAMKVDLRSQP